MEWIDVNDRLPDQFNKFGDTDYVLAFSNNTQVVAWYNYEDDKWEVAHHFASSEPLDRHNKVTHWIPLPEPPKE